MSRHDGTFSTAFWPTRKVVTKPGKVVIHYHRASQITLDLKDVSVECEAGMWYGPLNGNGIRPHALSVSRQPSRMEAS